MTLARKIFSRPGIFLLPNLFTTAALFAGFYSIVAAVDGNFQNAGAAIFVVMILDGMDGRVARLTNTSSAFGKEVNLGRRIPFTYLIGIILIFILIALDPPTVFLGLFGAYAASGPVYWLWRRRTVRRSSEGDHAG